MPVLGTKLRAPTPRRQLVARPRLTDRLSEGSLPRLILRVGAGGLRQDHVAGAGAGLGRARQGLDADDAALRRVAWLSLDDKDNDPRQFLTNLVAALQTVRPEVGR